MRKVERQYQEIAGSSNELLRVNESTVEAYIKRFGWDFARFQHQGKQLAELVEQIQSMASKVDEELKSLSTMYTEKNLLLGNTKRKKVINLTTSDFEDFLKPEDVARLDMVDTENLLTVMVVVPKALEQGSFCLLFLSHALKNSRLHMKPWAATLPLMVDLTGQTPRQSVKMTGSLAITSNAVLSRAVQ